MAFTANSTSLAMLAPQAFTIVGFGFGFGGNGATESESGAVQYIDSDRSMLGSVVLAAFNSTQLVICSDSDSAGNTRRLKGTSWRRVTA